ncbi:MAG TPA: AmmeMemoRadiSam system protein B [Candidatus Methylacidiphilales bacterium]|nr:AmmeMemoRadiSam system protein B [Candidatus Methylacidiphilales bacterium]
MTALSAQHHPDCYPSDPVETLAFFRDAFDSCPARELPPAPQKSSLLGIVTPHIDFRVSLRAYAAAFRPLLEIPPADAYIILGVGHRSHLEWNFDRRDYVTPLGRAICATELVDALAAEADPAHHFFHEAHDGEHSIEFVLLWLQALHQLHPAKSAGEKPVRFVPLLCGGMHAYVEGLAEWDDLADFHRLSRALAHLLQKAGSEKIRLIVSIDGCHLGPRFHHPFRVTPALLKATAAWEEILWTRAAQGDARKFLDWFRDEGNDRYFDGVGALALLLGAGASQSGNLTIQRTFYEQWFTERDASAVTYSSARILNTPP